MSNTFKSALGYLHKAAHNEKIDKRIVDLLSHPQRQIEVYLPLKLDSGEVKIIKGYRVQYNNWLGPFKGGLRFHADVDPDEITALSFWMMIKNAVVNVPFGGGKGGLQVNPKTLSRSELERLTRAFARALFPNIGPQIDIAAPDVNTNSLIMDWFEDEYSKAVGQPTPAIVTGKSVENSGLEGREEATGMGGVFVLEKLIRKLKLKKPLTVAVQGFGHVGSHIAGLLHKNGFKIVALSDSKGGIYDKDEQGFNIELIKTCKLQKGLIADCYCIGTVCDIATKRAGNITNEEILQLPVDILIPAALDGVITKENASSIGAKIILEMANGPMTEEADGILEKMGTLVVPDVLANAGGVTVSYYEWLQNMENKTWNLKEVESKLQRVMEISFEEVWRIHRQKNVPLRLAAYILALQRLSKRVIFS